MPKKPEPNWVEKFQLEVKKLDLKPGDVVIVKTPHSLTYDQMVEIRSRLKDVLHIENEIIVLAWGLDVAAATEGRIRGERARILSQFDSALALLKEKTVVQ